MADEDVRRRAHEIWEAEGHPDGRALNHWFQAKEELTAYKALGEAEYEAWQEGAVVTTRAKGMLPGRGFTAFLEVNRIEPGDPKAGSAFLGYMLMFRQTNPGPDQEPTPFMVERTFEYRAQCLNSSCLTGMASTVSSRTDVES
jgi:hypothetical protein